MKKSFIAAVLLVSVMLVSACGKAETKGESEVSPTASSSISDTGSSELPEKVVIGTQNLVDPEAIAKAAGWFDDMGVKTEIVQFDGGRDVNTAMASGEIDFGIVGSVPAALAVANGVDCKIVYIQSVLGQIESLVVNPDSKIKSAEDLKGKTIATVFSSTSHYSLLKYLEVNGISASDVDIVDMNASAIVAAYERGDVDGAFIWDPQVTELVNDGGEILTSAKEMAEQGYATMDMEIVKSDFAAKYPQFVKEYVKAMERSVELYKNDSKQAGKYLSESLGIDSSACLDQAASSTWLTLEEQKSADWFGGDSVVDTLYETAVFLHEQGDVIDEPTKEMFENAVDSQYLNVE